MREVCASVVAAALLPAGVALAYDRDDTYSGKTNTGRGVSAEIRGNHVRFFEAEVRVPCSDGSYVPWLVNTGKKHPDGVTCSTGQRTYATKRTSSQALG